MLQHILRAKRIGVASREAVSFTSYRWLRRRLGQNLEDRRKIGLPPP